MIAHLEAATGFFINELIADKVKNSKELLKRAMMLGSSKGWSVLHTVLIAIIGKLYN